MDENIQRALRASAYCETIKDGISGLCRILDVADGQFGETDRLERYKAMFREVSAWQQQYEDYLQHQSALPVEGQSM